MKNPSKLNQQKVLAPAQWTRGIFKIQLESVTFYLGSVDTFAPLTACLIIHSIHLNVREVFGGDELKFLISIKRNEREKNGF